MTELPSIINCLRAFFPRNFETFSSIINALLCMSGSKTMLNISRWTKEEVCYKTIERFYERVIPWFEMNQILIIKFVGCASEILLCYDETIAGKSGKMTAGIDFFFSSILQKPVKSVCFSGLSLIFPSKNKSYPLLMSQLIFTPEEKEVSKQKKEAKKKSKGRKAGRPKGSKNKKAKVEVLAATFRLLKEQQFIKVKEALKIKVKHFVGDGKYGNNTCAKLCKDYDMFLISKLQYNSGLYFENTEPYKGKGRYKKYGKRLDSKNLPKEFMVKEEIKENEMTRTFHMTLLSKSFDDKLNVVIVQKIIGEKVAHVIFFSTDLELNYQKVIDYYSSRFQIEFNFRDAKEFWGLKYFNETLKLLQEFNTNIYIPDSIDNVTSMGFIHV